MKRRDYIIALIITLSCVIALCLYYNCREYEIMLSKQKTAILSLTDTVNAMQAESTQYKQYINTLTEQIGSLQEQLDTKQDKVDRGSERGTRMIMEITAYWKGSCGKEPDDPEYGITASGQMVQDGFIAAGPELEIGARVYIPYFDRVFIVMDRGRDITNGHLDICMAGKVECNEFGRKWLEVYVLD